MSRNDKFFHYGRLSPRLVRVTKLTTKAPESVGRISGVLVCSLVLTKTPKTLDILSNGLVRALVRVTKALTKVLKSLVTLFNVIVYTVDQDVDYSTAVLGGLEFFSICFSFPFFIYLPLP